MAMTEASREVGVVVRRRAVDNPWVDHVWSPAMVLDEVPATAAWTVLSDEPDATVYYAGSASIDLFSSDTANYRDNLADGHRRSDRRRGDLRERLRRHWHRSDVTRDRFLDRGLCRRISCRAGVPQAPA
jgi:hypothetical protein